MIRLVLCSLLLAPSISSAEGAVRFGTARTTITPETPLWMAGYASRTQPCSEKLHDLWVKALALEDSAGNRVLILTVEVCGIPRELSERVSTRILEATGLKRSQLVLSCSHTHCGPAVWGNLTDMYNLPPDHPEKLQAYAKTLEAKLLDTARKAVANLAPGAARFASGSAGFARNRRERKNDTIVLGSNPEGPVDHAVPVLWVADAKGVTRAVLFGYACHNTTLAIDQWNGDYAGFAQLELERLHPEAQAMFWSGFAGDANPFPRGQLEHARLHGQELARAVDKALQGKGTEVTGSFRTQYREVALPLGKHPDPSQWAADALSKTPAVRNRALRMQQLLKTTGIPTDYPHYPVQTLQVAGQLDWVFLGGEVVQDYAARLRAGRAPDAPPLWLTAYCNDVPGYIPSARLLKEGGYEADSSQIYYGLPTQWSPKIEEVIVEQVQSLLRK